MSTLTKLFLAVALASFVVVGSARADQLFNNLGNLGTSADPTGDLWGPLADSFSTGSTSFDFTSLTVILSGTAATGSTTAYLLSDASGTPGSVLEEIGAFSETGLSAAPGLFSLSTSFLLAPHTTYWIELTSPDNNTDWQWTSDPSGVGTAGQLFANFAQGDTWNVNTEINGPYQMEVAGNAGAAVPEPGSLSLLLGGLLAAGFVGFRRRAFSRAN